MNTEQNVHASSYIHRFLFELKRKAKSKRGVRGWVYVVCGFKELQPLALDGKTAEKIDNRSSKQVRKKND
jgi:hypothetical protein